MATGDYHNFESHCCFCGIVLAAYRTRAHPKEPYPDARWDGGYPGDYVSVDDLAWAFEFRALRDSRGTYNDISPVSDTGDDAAVSPFFTGIGLFGPRSANSRALTAPTDPTTIHSDPDFQPSPDDTFSIFTSYVSFDNTSGRGFVFHAKCFEIFRTLLPDRFKDQSDGRRAFYVKPEVRDRLWEILSLVRKGFGNGDISGWDDGTSPFRQSINDGTFPSFIDHSSWSSTRTLLDAKAFGGKGMLPYIAADPLKIPMLQAILNNPPLISAASHSLQQPFSQGHGPRDLFSKLPNEILDIILCQLRSRDVASLRLAVRSIAESPLTNSFFRSRFKDPHEMHFIYESATARSVEGKIDWQKLYTSIKALLIAPNLRDDSDDDTIQTKDGKKRIRFDKTRHLRRFYRNRICPRLPPSPGLANRLRIHVILKPLIDRITLLIDTPLKGDSYTGILSFLADELSKYPGKSPMLDEFEPIIADKSNLPTSRRGIHYYLGEQGGLFGQPLLFNSASLSNQQVKLLPLRGRSRVRIRKTISSGPNVKRSMRDVEEQPPDQRQLIHSTLSCVENCARKCTWDPNAVITKIGFSFVGRTDDKSNSHVTPDYRKHACGLRFWGRLPSFSDDEIPEIEQPTVLLGEVGYIMRDELVISLPENHTWIGFMVGVTESGIVRLKPLTHPPWKAARWIGSPTSMTESKIGWNLWHEHEIPEQTSALAKRRAEGFKVIGPVHDYYVDFSYPAAEGRLIVSPDKWTIGGITVGLGTLRFTSIALIEYRNEQAMNKRDKGKGKATNLIPDLLNVEKVMVDGEEVDCKRLPLGPLENVLGSREHFDGVPDITDRYCWRPYFPVPHYDEDNVTDVNILPKNLSFAFPKTYIQDALLSAGLPVPPESHIYWNGPNFGPPPNSPPLRVPRNRDELNIMEYFDFGGPGGKYLRRLISVKAFYASHTNGAARGVSGFEFTYEMDEADVNECKLRDIERPQERYVEVRRGGVDLHYLSCAATIDGKGGERIIRVGTKHLCLSERSYLGVMLITNFGRKLEFPACLPPAPRRRSRRRLRRVPRVYPTSRSDKPPPPPDDGAGPAPTPYWLPSPGGPIVSLSAPPLASSTIASSSAQPIGVVTAPPPPFPIPLVPPPPPPPRTKKVKVADLPVPIPPPPYIPWFTKTKTKDTKEDAEEEKASKDGNTGSSTIGKKSTKTENEKGESDTANTTDGDKSESQTGNSDLSLPSFKSLISDTPRPLMASPDMWDDTFNLGTGKSEETKQEVDDGSETSTTYEFFNTGPDNLITGFFGCTDGKPYLGEGLKAFGVVTQTPSESEREILTKNALIYFTSPEELEPGAPTACFSQLERARYWQEHNDEDVIKDFVNKVDFSDPIARVRVFCRPSYHIFSGYSKHAANGVGLVFEYFPEDLVEDGSGGWRPRASRVLGELREENATGTFELERDERIDGVWVWCADRTRVSKSHVNELGYRGADVIAALRFRTDKGRCSKTFGGDRSGTCHFFESSGRKRLIGLRMTYDYMSDWISPIWREEEVEVVAEKPDLKLRYIPFGWSVLNRPLSVIQVFADSADQNDFGADQIKTIRGYFDHQFRGLVFIYKTGHARYFGKCVGASTDCHLEEGERIFALRYRPGSNFCLHFSLVKVDPETGDITTRSTPIFGVDVAGFGLPPLNEYVRDTKSWRHIFEDEVKPAERDYNYSTDESSDYNSYPSSTRHPLEDSYETQQNNLRVRTATSLETNVIQGHFKWDENGFVDIRPPTGYDFAGLWLQEVELDFKLGMLVTPMLNPDSPLAAVDYSELNIPPPQSSLLPVLDPYADSDDSSLEVKTFNGRPFVPPLPWLGTYPADQLPGDAIVSRKVGAQIGAVRLWALMDKSQIMDINVYYGFPTRLIHIHGIEFTQFIKPNRRPGAFPRHPDATRLGTTGFMTTLCKATKVTNKMRMKRMVGLKVGMVPDIYQRIPAPTPGTPPRDVKLADWPIKVRRNKGGEPQIVTLEIILEDGETVALTPSAKESTHRNKCPPQLIYDTVMCPEGQEIIGLHGNFGLYCHAIGIISAPFRENEKKLSPPRTTPPPLISADDIIMSFD
ncbi:hypothetical protein TWF694_002259 [Orbilia ellipsospora]|uniref:F-box domain-containing protein n=1 Tax=Orbilia ellipsospora TaxID=2528407 RepID=A0AAV9X1H6_9PEZI